MLELWSLGLHPVQKKICGVHGRAAARLLLIAGPPPCSNQAISPGRRTHGSKPAAATCGGRTAHMA